MNRKAYILIFDRDDDVDYKEFHNSITKLSNVLNWWHYIKSSYILITDTSTATELNNLIKPLVPKDKSILIMEVNLKNRNGLLVKEAWDWMKKEQVKL